MEKVRFNAETELPSPASFCRGLAIVACTLLIKHGLDLSHVASGVLIVSAACLIENMDRALYSAISCATPLLMALHLALTGRIISLHELAIFVPISLLYIASPCPSASTATSPTRPQKNGGSRAEAGSSFKQRQLLGCQRRLQRCQR